MISKNEYLYAKSRLAKLEDLIFHFEVGQIWKEEKDKNGEEVGQWVVDKDSLYKAYLTYSNMSIADKELLANKWKQYYKDVKAGPRAQLYFNELKPAFIAGNMELVKALVAKSKTLPLSGAKQPSSIDPDELLRKLNGYMTAKSATKVLRALVKEYKDIYEIDKTSKSTL